MSEKNDGPSVVAQLWQAVVALAQRLWKRWSSESPPRYVRLVVFLAVGALVTVLAPFLAYLVLGMALGPGFQSFAYDTLIWAHGWWPELVQLDLDPSRQLTMATAKLGVGAFSAGVLVTLLERVRRLPTLVVDYFAGAKPWSERFGHLTDQAGTFLVAGVTVLVGVYALLHDESSDGGEGAGGALPAEVMVTMPLLSMGAASSLEGLGMRLHVLFAEGDSVLAQADPQWQYLRALLSTAVACSDTVSTFQVRATGYASSSGSNQDNLALANGRSRWLKGALDREATELAAAQVGSTIPEVGVRTHRGYPAMAAGMFADSVAIGGSYSVPAGALNRRVELSVLDLGRCGNDL